jgi:hypothetical protein
MMEARIAVASASASVLLRIGRPTSASRLSRQAGPPRGFKLKYQACEHFGQFRRGQSQSFRRPSLCRRGLGIREPFCTSEVRPRRRGSQYNRGQPGARYRRLTREGRWRVPARVRSDLSPPCIARDGEEPSSNPGHGWSLASAVSCWPRRRRSAAKRFDLSLRLPAREHQSGLM